MSWLMYDNMHNRIHRKPPFRAEASVRWFVGQKNVCSAPIVLRPGKRSRHRLLPEQRSRSTPVLAVPYCCCIAESIHLFDATVELLFASAYIPFFKNMLARHTQDYAAWPRLSSAPIWTLSYEWGFPAHSAISQSHLCSTTPLCITRKPCGLPRPPAL